MTSAPVPVDETERLAALRRYDVLDTAPEPSFDEIAHLVSYICDAPISVVGLIDSDRLWFKSAVGFGMHEVRRDVAFCAHAIIDKALLTISDATRDERFIDNPLVTDDPYVRFYAGAPLVTR